MLLLSHLAIANTNTGQPANLWPREFGSQMLSEAEGVTQGLCMALSGAL